MKIEEVLVNPDYGLYQYGPGMVPPAMRPIPLSSSMEIGKREVKATAPGFLGR